MRSSRPLLAPIAIFALVAVAACGLVSGASAAEERNVHRVAIHVDENDPARMNLALNNVQNIEKHYRDQREDVHIEVVAYGPSLPMLRADTSPVRDRIEEMSLAQDNLRFAACGNTRARMSEQAGAAVELLPEATMVPSGVVRLMELQEQGWSYVRP